jgi:WD40 repeat protein
VITAAVARCDVLLALVGDQWLTITGEDGRRRLDDPDDFVRLEIEAALTRNVRVIPVLVDGARMPRAGELPPSLAKLVRRQALELSPSRFASDTGQLLRVLDGSLAEAQVRQTGAGPEVPAPSAPPGHKADTHRTSVSDQAVAMSAPSASSSGPDTADIQEASEAPGSRVRRMLFLPYPRRRAAALIGLGVVLVTAVMITAILTTQSGPSSRASSAGHTGGVISVAFNQDGSILASASLDHTVRLWNTSTHRRIGQPLQGDSEQLFTVAFSPDGKEVASGVGGNAQLWNTATHGRIATFNQHSGRVLDPPLPKA